LFRGKVRAISTLEENNMRLTHSILVGALAIGLTAGTAAAQTAKPAPAKQTTTAPKASAAKPAAAKPARATTVRATGKLATFDAASKMLTLTTPKGSQQFTLTATTKLEEGSKTIDMDALPKLTGRNVTVSYVESGGQKTVQMVRVAGPAKAAAAKKS
jgi:hypothetical protein